MPTSPNAGQAEFWNAQPGQNWVTFEADLEAITRGVTEVLMAAAAPAAGEQVLDIGCGTGGSTFALAEAVGPAGHVIGSDISAAMLQRAETHRAARAMGHVRFEEADAQTHAFEPSSIDLAASRFGGMVFADPVAAFRNIARALRPGGRIAFVAWAAPEANPWFALPQRVAVERLGPVPPSDPHAPGPMAFRDIDRVTGLLQAAGLADCKGATVATELHHPGDVEAIVRLLRHVGPMARVLREKGGTPEDEAAILATLREEFGRYRSADGLRIPAALNVFTGHGP